MPAAHVCAHLVPSVESHFLVRALGSSGAAVREVSHDPVLSHKTQPRPPVAGSDPFRNVR